VQKLYFQGNNGSIFYSIKKLHCDSAAFKKYSKIPANSLN
jgi:hypothetical protein